MIPLVLAAMLALTACARVQPHVLLPNVQLGEPSFFPTLEAYASTPIMARNAVQVLLNGEEIFPAMIEAIHSAKTSITYAQYYFEDGPVARDPYFVPDETMEDALTGAVRRGVRVVVLVPGAIDHNLVRQASRGKFGKMLKAGLEIYDAATARRLEGAFTADLAHSVKVDYRSWRQRSFSDRVLEILAVPIRPLL